MMKIKYLVLFIFSNLVTAQTFEQNNFSVSINYTTTSKIFFNPFSSDLILKSTYIELNDLTSFSFEYRTQLMEDVFISLNTEYLSKKFSFNNYNLFGEQATTNDKFLFIPIELCFYYYLPFSNDDFKFFMGGGTGIFFGKFKRELGNQIANSKMLKTSYGINVVIGLDYNFYKNFSTRFLMRFRDPELTWKNNYTSNTVVYNNKTYLLNTSTFYTKANIDGIIFSLGIVYNF